jgi:hypothetical protein
LKENQIDNKLNITDPIKTPKASAKGIIAFCAYGRMSFKKENASVKIRKGAYKNGNPQE